MYRSRVIPVLLISDGGVVKTRQFKNPTYVGDPLNSVKIFNEKEVDELVILDIDCSPHGAAPNYSRIEEIAGECFMPICYGGGIKTVEQVRRVFDCGVEKIAINSAAENLSLISEAAALFGSQSIVVSIDCKKKSFFGGYTVTGKSGTEDFKASPIEFAVRVQNAGAGEIFLHSIDNDGMMGGFDLKLVSEVSAALTIPVVAVGGAGTIDHLIQGLAAGASAVAAGSMFVFHGKHRAVLISYPDAQQLSLLNKR